MQEISETLSSISWYYLNLGYISKDTSLFLSFDCKQPFFSWNINNTDYADLPLNCTTAMCPCFSQDKVNFFAVAVREYLGCCSVRLHLIAIGQKADTLIYLKKVDMSCSQGKVWHAEELSTVVYQCPGFGEHF